MSGPVQAAAVGARAFLDCPRWASLLLYRPTGPKTDGGRLAIRIPDSFTAPGDVTGKRVIVTGASRGLGSVIAAAFSQAGAKVALTARDKDTLNDVARRLPGQTLVCPADVSEPEANELVVDRVVQQWGGLDVWIGNAGISPVVAKAADMDPAVWRQIMDVNLHAVFYGMRAAAPCMGPGGRLIVTASVLGERPMPGLSAYSVSKAGVVALVKSVAQEVSADGLTANAVAPGWFDSPLANSWKKSASREQSILDHTALHRWGASEDLPGVYLFLASDAAAYITGTVFAVDGGFLTR